MRRAKFTVLEESSNATLSSAADFQSSQHDSAPAGTNLDAPDIIAAKAWSKRLEARLMQYSFVCRLWFYGGFSLYIGLIALNSNVLYNLILANMQVSNCQFQKRSDASFDRVCPWLRKLRKQFQPKLTVLTTNTLKSRGTNLKFIPCTKGHTIKLALSPER